MRSGVLWTMLGFIVAVIAAVVLVNHRAGGVPVLPPPDPRLPIQLPDGRSLPLAELIARLDTDLALVEPLVLPGGAVARAHEPPANDTLPPDPIERFAENLYPGIGWGPVFKLAEHHRQAGRLDQSLALFQSVPPGDPDYARAQRRIAWSILTYERNEPEAAVPYAHRALAAEPYDGNSWQDLVRVYGRTIGLPVE
jgi:hypothetical protein